VPNPNWFQQRLRDPFLKKAHSESLRSRAAYKLQEIHEKYKLIKPNHKVLDLGCAPGSWTQIAAKFLSPKGLLVGIDLVATEPVEGATILQGDIRDKAMQTKIRELCPNRFDLILSDMAPNTTGVHHADTANSADLVSLVLDLCSEWLKPGGSMVAKVFEGSEYQALHKRAKSLFDFAKSVNPEASLSRSREVYLVGQGYRGHDEKKSDKADKLTTPMQKR